MTQNIVNSTNCSASAQKEHVLCTCWVERSILSIRLFANHHVQILYICATQSVILKPIALSGSFESAGPTADPLN